MRRASRKRARSGPSSRMTASNDSSQPLVSEGSVSLAGVPSMRIRIQLRVAVRDCCRERHRWCRRPALTYRRHVFTVDDDEAAQRSARLGSFAHGRGTSTGRYRDLGPGPRGDSHCTRSSRGSPRRRAACERAHGRHLPGAPGSNRPAAPVARFARSPKRATCDPPSSPARASVILLDTAPIVALCDPRDALNRTALRDLDRLAEQPFVVCAPVLTEACFLLPRSAQRERLRRFLMTFAVAAYRSDDESQLWVEVFEWLARYHEHDPDWADGYLVVLSGKS